MDAVNIYTTSNHTAAQHITANVRLTITMSNSTVKYQLPCSTPPLSALLKQRSQAARQRQHCVNGDRLEIGKWQNSTPHRFKTPKPIAKKKLAWMIRSARGPDMPNLVEIGSRGSSGKMCAFWNCHSFFIYTVNHKKRWQYIYNHNSGKS